MKIIKILIIGLFLFGCNSSLSSQSNHSRFKNTEFISVLDSMMQKFPYKEGKSKKFTTIFLMTENHIYISMLDIDCSVPNLYHFQEKVNSIELPIYIQKVSTKPERFFDLSNLEITKDSIGYSCDDYFSVIARLDVKNDKVYLAKLRRMGDEGGDDFVAEEDSMYVQTRVRILEPESNVKTEKDENN